MNNIKGIVKFKSYNNKCTINYQIKNLDNGKHGFHVHKHGDLSQGCTSGCEHFNPDKQEHGGPHSKIRHAGDLGNINLGELFARASRRFRQERAADIKTAAPRKPD